MEDWSRRAAPDPVEAVEGPGRPVVAGCASEAPGRVPPAPVAPAPRQVLFVCRSSIIIRTYAPAIVVVGGSFTTGVARCWSSS